MDLAELPSVDFESIIKSAVKEMETHPVMDLPDEYTELDLTSEFDRDSMTAFIKSGGWAVGGYLERRAIMYNAPRYADGRDIHMGIDIWAEAGEPVYAVLDGEVAYSKFQNDEGNYGGTLILKHIIEGQELYALHGHLSKKSLERHIKGEKFKTGDVIGWLGEESENGNWPTHLHYQLCIEDPGEPDMPGVVAKKNLIRARERYPDPRILLGDIY
ncbi:MAG: peptidoglycan DD-metalloendopeptidase family protein [Balneolaceae bacterium]|nr:peptidoglycan DD-metalloendopeptidase family protein [Balneolaceae bacterium]